MRRAQSYLPLCLLLGLWLIGVKGTAQIRPIEIGGSIQVEVVGPTAVCNGQLVEYHATVSEGYCGTYTWITPGGTIESGQGGPYVSVRYHTTGTHSLYVQVQDCVDPYLNPNNSSGSGFLSVQVMETPNQPWAQVDNQCGSSIVNVVSNGGTLFWQNNPEETSTAEPAGSYTEYSSRIRYLRAVIGHCWSPAVEVQTAPKLPVPGIPAAPIVANAGCSSTTLTLAAPAPWPEVYYWSLEPNSEDKSNSSNTYTVSYSQRVYLRAYNTQSGCWGPGSAHIDVTVPGVPVPGVPAAPVIASASCSSTTLTLAAPAPWPEVYYWSLEPNSEDRSNSSSHFAVSGGSRVFLRAYNPHSGCWGPSSSFIDVAAPAAPEAPPIPTLTPQCSGVEASLPPPPTGVSYYWQTAPDGTSTAVPGNSKIYSEDGTYWVRARNGQGCWSASRQFEIRITGIPMAVWTDPVPAWPATDQGGNSLTSYVNNADAIVLWQWLFSLSGYNWARGATDYAQIHVRQYWPYTDCNGKLTQKGIQNIASYITYVIAHERHLIPIAQRYAINNNLEALSATGIPGLLPSANALSIVEPPQHQKGLATGTPEISVPLHTIQSRSLSLPIRLDYDARGVRIGEMASWVGLNWRLEAGGAVARVVHGRLDQYAEANGQIHVGNTEEQDIFYFSVGGIVGKFAFYPNSGNAGAGVFRTIPYSHWQITPTLNGQGDITGFRLVSESGTEFLFGGANAYEESEIIAEDQASVRTPILLAHTAWYIREINASDRADQIRFVYATETPAVAYHVAGVSKRLTPGVPPTLTSAAIGGYTEQPAAVGGFADVTQCGSGVEQVTDYYSILHRGIHFARLASIQYVGGSVEFVPGNNRCDLPGTSLLWKINVYYKEQLAKTYDTYHDYFNLVGNCDTPIDNSRRLRLTTLYQRSVLIDNLLPLVTRFSYDTRKNLPSRKGNFTDVWGYFNNIDNDVRISPGGNGGPIRTATTDSTIASTWMLTSIRTPLGAITRYDWEPNVTTAGPVGGVRLKRTTVMPDGVAGAPENIIRRYEYLTAGIIGQINSRQPSGRPFTIPYWMQNAYAVVDGPAGAVNQCCPYQVWWGSTYPLGYGLLGEWVVYEGVWEFLGENGELGASHYQYVPGPDDVSYGPSGTSYAGSPWTSRAWRHGYLSREQHFDMAAGFDGRKLVAETIYERVVYDHRPPSHQYRSQPNYITRTLHFGGVSASFSNTYWVESGWSHPTRTIATTYTQDDHPQPVTSLTQYTYNPNTMLVTNVEQMPVRSSSDLTPIGRIEGTYLKYAEDYNFVSQKNVFEDPAHPIRIIKDLNWKGVPVEVLSYYKHSLAGERMITGGNITFFGNYQHNGYWWAPKSFTSRSLKLGAPLAWSSIEHSTVSAYLIVCDY